MIVPLLPGFALVVVGRAALGLAIGAVPAVAMAYLAEELVAHRVPVAAGIFVAGNTFGGDGGGYCVFHSGHTRWIPFRGVSLRHGG
ncbi:MAG: hypothetical protein QM673_13170 [Gordonia sp. (in: high G+C Gram-positive bacteria)]